MAVFLQAGWGRAVSSQLSNRIFSRKTVFRAAAQLQSSSDEALVRKTRRVGSRCGERRFDYRYARGRAGGFKFFARGTRAELMLRKFASRRDATTSEFEAIAC
jgi:hypothetical protein